LRLSRARIRVVSLGTGFMTQEAVTCPGFFPRLPRIISLFILFHLCLVLFLFPRNLVEFAVGVSARGTHSAPISAEKKSDINQDWWGHAQRNIAAAEYSPSVQHLDDQGVEFDHPRWHFANRAHNLRTYIDRDGRFEIIPRIREAGHDSWRWQFTLGTLTRGD